MRENSRRSAPRQARASGRPEPGRSGTGTRPARHVHADAARVTSVIEPVLDAMDIDLEAVRIATAGRRLVLRIVVDADGGVSLDDIAEVSREVSARLDAKNAMGDAPYTLEVSSPGVDRPLTEPRHWRRAIGRLVVVPVTAQDSDPEREPPGGLVPREARVIDADEHRVLLDIGGTRRALSYGQLGPGRVQVEFGRLSDVDDLDEAAGLRDLGDFEESWGGPDEEGPDGH